MVARRGGALLTREDSERWDRKHAAASPSIGAPSAVLLTCESRLPRTGRALDVACGLGANALHLAARGLVVDAVDVSGVALARLAAAARAARLEVRIRPVRMDLDAPAFGAAAAGAYAVVLCLSFLDRRLLPLLPTLLAPSGWLLFEAFHAGYRARRPEFRREWLLDRGEAARAFPALDVVDCGEDDARAWVLARRLPT
jgi:SAM-dependent methyltransferase